MLPYNLLASASTVEYDFLLSILNIKGLVIFGSNKIIVPVAVCAGRYTALLFGDLLLLASIVHVVYYFQCLILPIPLPLKSTSIDYGPCVHSLILGLHLQGRLSTGQSARNAQLRLGLITTVITP
jgi:hypothetical protein